MIQRTPEQTPRSGARARRVPAPARRAVRAVLTALEELRYRHLHRPTRIPAAPGPAGLLHGGAPPAEIAAALRRDFPQAWPVRAERLAALLHHEFDLLGSGLQRLSDEGTGYCPIDWHRDARSGHHWNPRTFHRRISVYGPPGTDIKMPWELSRGTHWIRLGQAFAVTGDESYVGEFHNQIADWLDHNPVGFGVNWACTMEVAIRAANWMAAWELLGSSPALSDPFRARFLGAVRDHGRFIRSHLEYSPELTSNHYLANLAGLLAIALCCPFLPESRGWREFAAAELEREITEQVFDDGCCREASTSYHRFVLELLFYSDLLAARAGHPLSAHFRERLHSMFLAVVDLIGPDGQMPQIGDNDNGHHLDLVNRPVGDHRYLLALGAVHFGDPTLKLPELPLLEELLWVFGPEGVARWQALPARALPRGGRAFDRAGWFVLRSGGDQAVVACGPNGPLDRGTHAHNDKLSVTLAVDGRPLLVDPGSFAYTPFPAERNRFRATAAHNTVQAGDLEQNPIPENLFRLPNRVAFEALGLADSPDEPSFTGRIRYAGVTHERRVRCLKQPGIWIIEDALESGEGGVARFHLAPGLLLDADGWIAAAPDGPRLARITAGRPAGSSAIAAALPIATRPYEYSPSYGVKVPAVCLEIPLVRAEPAQILRTRIESAPRAAGGRET